MLGFEPEIASSALRLLIAAGSALAVVIICALALGRSRKGAWASSGRVLLVILAALVGGAMTWALLTSGDRAAQRRALELRFEQLSAQAMAPGSPLACLDALIGKAIEATCEKAVFASPASAATAIAYVGARFALLADMTEYVRRGGAGIESELRPLRRALETDRFGLLAQVLATRDDCTGEHCKALALLSDPSEVRTNLGAETFARYVDHYQAAWSKLPEAALAEMPTEGQATAAAHPLAAGQHKVVDIDFPSAASIPPISIMNPEPKGTAAAAPSAGATPPATASARRARKRAPAPQDGAPASAAAQAEPARADPVWTPAPSSPPATGAAPR